MARKRIIPSEGGVGYRVAGFIGGVIGVVMFLVIALVPSLVYGGYVGVLLAVALLGPPIGASLIARGIVGFGMLTGALATAGLFVVVSAMVATAAYWALAGVARRVPAREDTASVHP